MQHWLEPDGVGSPPFQPGNQGDSHGRAAIFRRRWVCVLRDHGRAVRVEQDPAGHRSHMTGPTVALRRGRGSFARFPCRCKTPGWALAVVGVCLPARARRGGFRRTPIPHSSPGSPSAPPIACLLITGVQQFCLDEPVVPDVLLQTGPPAPEGVPTLEPVPSAWCEQVRKSVPGERASCCSAPSQAPELRPARFTPLVHGRHGLSPALDRPVIASILDH